MRILVVDDDRGARLLQRALLVRCEAAEAVLGQRIFAVSRDIYDIFSLLAQVDEKRVLEGMPRKLDVRGLGLEQIEAGRLARRREEFRADWERNLVHLLPPGGEAEFDEVWDPVSEYITRVAAAL